jgi:hypothetical protein
VTTTTVKTTIKVGVTEEEDKMKKIRRKGKEYENEKKYKNALLKGNIYYHMISKNVKDMTLKRGTSTTISATFTILTQWHTQNILP